MNTKTNSIVAVILIAVSIFTSCTKEGNNISTNNATKNASNIPFFANIEAVEHALDFAMSADSLQVLVQYEESENRASIGRLSDVFYAQVDPEQFKSEEQVLKFVDDYSIYMDTLIDENNEISVEPKFSNNIFRYVANSDGLFIVADTIFKIFKNGVVSADKKYTKEISLLQEGDLTTIDTSIFTWINFKSRKGGSHSATCNYKKYFSNTAKDGRDRIVVDFYILEYPVSLLYYKPYLKIKSQHRFILWWSKSRKITLSLDFDIHNSVYGYWETMPYHITSATKTTSEWTNGYSLIWVPNYNQDFVHLIRGGYIQASTSAAGTARINI